MRMQTEMIQVKNDPKIINEVNSNAAIWGWSVLNIQITDQKIVREGDSKGGLQQGFFNDKYVVTTEVITEHVNYASITYQRDLDDPRTAKLAELEKAYYSCENADYLSREEANAKKEAQDVLDKKDRIKLFAKISFCAAIVSFILLFFVDLFDYLFILFLSLGISLGIYAIVSPAFRAADKKDYELVSENKRRREAKQLEIKNKALALQ